ncbi:hypothetical protein KAW48_01625 [candidate division WOR-3 bacterium]|nr:hypothetical protein [candidate division WOR-3 bacterium]
MSLNYRRLFFILFLLIFQGCLDWDIVAEREDANGIYIQFIGIAYNICSEHLKRASEDLLISFENDEVRFIDISERKRPDYGGKITLSSRIKGVDANRERVYVAHYGGNCDSISVFIISNGFFIKEKTLPLNISLEENVLEAGEEKIYSASSNFLLEIDPEIGSIDKTRCASTIKSIVVDNRYLYLLLGDGISVYDNGYKLLLSESRFPYARQPCDLQKHGDYLYYLSVSEERLYRARIIGKVRVDCNPENRMARLGWSIMDFSISEEGVCLTPDRGLLLDFSGVVSPSIKEEFAASGEEILTVDEWIYVKSDDDLVIYEIIDLR